MQSCRPVGEELQNKMTTTLKVIEPSFQLDPAHDLLDTDPKFNVYERHEETGDNHSSKSSAGNEPFEFYSLGDDGESAYRYPDLPTPSFKVCV